MVEEAAGVHYFQLAQTAPDRLLLRLRIEDPAARARAWRLAAAALRAWLAGQALSGVNVALDTRPPVVGARSGKLRMVVQES
jgi:hypothetical protein